MLLVKLVAVVVIAVASFVSGVLVGRRNRQKVEAAVSEANKLATEIKAKV